MTEDESDVFEITDFTTASEWERFIAKLEEVLHEWRLATVAPFTPLEKGELSSGQWEENAENVDFAGFQFTLTRHTLTPTTQTCQATSEAENAQVQKEGKIEDEETEDTPVAWQDMMSVANDFPGRAHCLCRYYGLRDFVTMQPATGMDDIMTESRANLLMSSVAIAINNTACKVPIFVQIHSKWRKMYSGHFEMAGFRTNFEMVHLKHAPKPYRHLSGLLDVFNTKIASAVPERPPVSVAVRFTYVLQEWPLYEWSQAPPDMDSLTGEEVGAGDFGVLPFGACTDPVGDLQLSVTWPSLSEELVVDGDVYSDLNPLQAPHWSVKVRMTDDPQCLLGDYLDEFVELCRNQKSADQLLGRAVMDTTPDDVKVQSALDKLADPAYNIPTIGNVMSRTTTVVTRATTKLQIKPEEAPIPGDLLNDILVYLFPDAKEDLLKSSMKGSTITSAAKSRDAAPDESANQQASKPDSTELQEALRQLKAAPTDSVTLRLAVVMCVLNHSYGGVRAVAHLWQEFVLEMRYRWENNHTISDLEHGSPNMGYSLLHQKLQMLNCCIERKKSRESAPHADLDLPLQDQAEGQATSLATDETDSGISKSKELQLEKSASNSDKTAVNLYKDEINKTEKEKCNLTTAKAEASAWDLDSASLSSEDEFFECEDDEDTLGNSTNPSVENSASSERVTAKVSRSSSRASKLKGEKRTRSDSNISAKSDTSEQADVTTSQSKQSNPQSSQSVNKSRKENNQSENRSRKSSNQSENRSRRSSGQSAVIDETSLDGSFSEVYGHVADGRLKPCGELMLLGGGGRERMYVPVTQEPAPMTEDMLDEHAEVLAKLGTGEEGMHLRARMQSASLLSDMESFKAANPPATLADFVRWYSPRDWVTVEERDNDGQLIQKGELSQRMQIPGNMWVEVWHSAKPIPARRQKRLFDDTKEAEKVLHWLSALKPSDVALRLVPMLVLASLRRLHEVAESAIPAVRTLLLHAQDRATKLMRAPNLHLNKIEELVRLLGHAEVTITRAQSLQQKLCHEKHELSISDEQIQNFVASLLDQPEVNVISAGNSPIGKIIHNLFKASQKSAHMMGEEDTEQAQGPDSSGRRQSFINIPDFPAPAGKEYILRTLAQRPAPWSRPSPQRMYSSWVHNEFRLLGAFTSDTTFQ